MTLASFTRRHALFSMSAVAALSVLTPAPSLAAAKAALGLAAGSKSDQSEALQAAIDAAVRDGAALSLPVGEFRASGLKLPSGLRLLGVPGHTKLVAVGDGPVATIDAATDIVIENVGFAGSAMAGTDETPGLVELSNADAVTFRGCSFSKGPGNGISITQSDATIETCKFDQLGQAAIYAMDSKGLLINGNRIEGCGNAGIRIWRSTAGTDGTIIMGNRIARIDWHDGGNGQTGNGINIYLADEVIISDNHIADCAFTAIRANGTRNTQIHSNTCLRSGEVAIFSEFGFSGSVVANNIVDGAATGISITNLDSGGHLATCTGNIVRNISERSAVNPDTQPVGIYAEAETVVANNTVDSVPGIGIAAGYGPFVRNLVVAGNIVTGAKIGIAVSVVQDAPAGPVRISGNVISGATDGAIVGAEWEKIVTTDLVRDAGTYPNISVTDNTVG
jgi:uncharacterized secreted repeat protein (TIGR03808 family)